MRILVAAVLLLFAGALAATDAPVAAPLVENAKLATLFAQDQAARSGSDIDWAAMSKADAARREQVQAMLAAGTVRSANDYYHAAMVFQHGDTLADFRLANALATLAMQLDSGNEHYRWLAGASWDRLLMRQMQPQWYGTQYKGDARGMYLFPVASDAVSDAERTAMVGHTLAESLAHLATAASEMGLPVRNPAPTLETLREEAAAANLDH
ncbi:hypothetical protein MQC88_02795 [Luteimonas sp. 50]|uniref:Uncharacterized protein n=1 Tax=Cognatiluteimonas sedimenti TaxID=2927791 RepID=A0ABT0A1M7_9GAMM|nr:hypothetical protein [Lysobacter sedimenti]MCJ0824895.1 hypothetical protein [Lysobacter sedimenti]